jgi:hypothetical protein
MFDQIFTIHTFVGDVMFPWIFSKRDTATYNRFFIILNTGAKTFIEYGDAAS